MSGHRAPSSRRPPSRHSWSGSASAAFPRYRPSSRSRIRSPLWSRSTPRGRGGKSPCRPSSSWRTRGAAGRSHLRKVSGGGACETGRRGGPTGGLWGGVTSWLLARPPGPAEEVVRPETLIQSRGERLRWEVSGGGGEPGAHADSGGGRRGGRGPPASLPGAASRRRRGCHHAARRARCLPLRCPKPGGCLPRFHPREWPRGGGALGPISSPAPARPRRRGRRRAPRQGRCAARGQAPQAHPLPYLLLLLLLSAEWIGRRRVGLR